MDLNASSAPAVRSMLAALLRACAALPAAKHAADLEAAAAAIAAAAAAAKHAAAEPEPEADPAAAEAEAAAEAVVADVEALAEEEEARAMAAPPPAPEEGAIKTSEDPESIRRRVEALQVGRWRGSVGW